MVKKTAIILFLLASVCFSQTTEKIGIGDCNGLGCDRADISTWETNLGGGAQIGVCYNDGTFQESVTINDPDPTSVTLTVATGERHDGTSGSGTTLESNGVVGIAVQLGTVSHVIEWLEITEATGGVNVDHLAIQTAASNGTFRYLIMYGISSVNNDAYGLQVRGNADKTGLNTYNCIIYDIVSTNSVGIGIGTVLNGDHVMNVFNTTIDTCSHYGIFENSGASSSITAKNTVVTGTATADFSGTFHASSDFNASQDATAPDNGNSITSIDPAAQFTSRVIATADYHLKSGNSIENEGTDLSGSGVTDDIDEDSRPQGAAYDIGADEVVSAEAPTPAIRKFVPPIYWNYKWDTRCGYRDL